MKVHEFRHEMRTTSNIFARSHGINVVFEGAEAKTEGNTIHLPAMPDDVKLSGEQVRIMRGYVDKEAGNLRHSDVPYIKDKHDRWENSGKKGLVAIHTELQDIWVSSQVIEEYPGAEKNIGTLDNKVSSNYLSAVNEAGISDKDMQEFFSTLTPESIQASLSSLGKAETGGTSNQEIADRFIPENIQEHVKNWSKLAKECTSTEEVVDLAKSIYKMIEEDPSGSSAPEDFDPESGKEDEDGEPSKDNGEDKSEGKGEGSEDQSSGEGEGEEGNGGKEVKASDLKPSDNIEALTEAHSEVIQEGDYTNGHYTIKTDRYDTVSTKTNPNRTKLNNTDTSVFEKSRNKNSGVVSTMKAKLRRALLAKQQRDWDYGKEMGRLDSKRLVAGYSRSPTVYKTRTDRMEMDTAVFILVDLSGSMSGSKVQVARDTVIAVASCFEGTSISYTIVGFDASVSKSYPYGEEYYESMSYGVGQKYHRWDANNMFVFKGFNDNLRSSRGALSVLHQTGLRNNADRDAIVWAVNELKRRPEKRKVLFVLSDGNPQHWSNAGKKELSRHAKIVVEGAKKDGIESVGIGIKTEAVKEIYKDNVVVNNVSDLSGVVFQKLTRILLG